MIIIKSLEQFCLYKLSRSVTVVVANEYYVSAIAAGAEGRCKCKEGQCFDEMNQSKTDAFEIIAKLLQKIEN